MTSGRASWPTPADYQDVLQHPEVCFRDLDLRRGAVESGPLGLPWLRSGASASTACVAVDNARLAVRCFIRSIPDDRQQRYSAVSAHLRQSRLSFIADFEYVAEGVLVKGVWRPIVRMQWVAGRWLSTYVEELATAGGRNGLAELAVKWQVMIGQLQSHGVAHGDLQHGNVLVTADRALVLVDYDGMFVPALRGLRSDELGHPNYQHPRRDERHFGPDLDNFSALAIYVALRALADDPGLWALIRPEESILWRSDDFHDPDSSRLFQRLLKSSDSQLVRLTRALREHCLGDIEAVPRLASLVKRPHVFTLAAGRTLTVHLPAGDEGTAQLVPRVRSGAGRPEVGVVLQRRAGAGKRRRLRVRLRSRFR